MPATWPPAPDNEAKIAAYVAQRGERALQQAITGGQCEYPDGLFYGGARPAWSNQVLRGMLRQHGAHRARIGWIDFHTGLGPRGHGEKIYAGRNVQADLARTRSWWGEDVTSFLDGSSSSATLSGVNYNAIYDECSGVPYAGIALEFGTLSMPDMIEALRADQWLMNHPDADAALREAIKRQVRAAFYCDAATGSPPSMRRRTPRAWRPCPGSAIATERSCRPCLPFLPRRSPGRAARPVRRRLGQRRDVELPALAGRHRRVCRPVSVPRRSVLRALVGAATIRST